jgi:ribosomal protein S18 acetylase RimI-like enzyme
MAGILIVPAAPQDGERLSQIAQAAKRYWGYPERWLALWQAELTLSAEYIGEHHVYKAIAEDATIGFYSLTIREQEADIDHLWIDPDFIGQGIGRRLWEHAAALAERLEALRLVVLSDPHAEGFYLRMGMTRAGEQVYTLDEAPRTLPRLVLALPHPADHFHPRSAQ